mgnify:CR=1 FL=1
MPRPGVLRRASLEVLRAEAHDELSTVVWERLHGGEDPWAFMEVLPTIDEFVVLGLRSELIAADNGRFAIPAARLGIVVGHHEIDRLVRLIGPGNSSYILLSGRTIDAAEAFRLGLVTKVVPLEESDSYVEELAREIADLAPLSHRVHKQILRQVVDNPSSADLTAEEATIPFVNFDSEDFQEGRRAFLERRKPRFSGH